MICIDCNTPHEGLRPPFDICPACFAKRQAIVDRGPALYETPPTFSGADIAYPSYLVETSIGVLTLTPRWDRFYPYNQEVSLAAEEGLRHRDQRFFLDRFTLTADAQVLHGWRYDQGAILNEARKDATNNRAAALREILRSVTGDWCKTHPAELALAELVRDRRIVNEHDAEIQRLHHAIIDEMGKRSRAAALLHEHPGLRGEKRP